MAAQNDSSPIIAKLKQMGLDKGHEQVKHKKADYGDARLPGGIRNGIAQLKMCKLGILENGDHKGMPYFMAYGTVKSPKEVEGVNVEGLLTRIGPEPICNTPEKTGERSRKTALDHYDWVLNQLRILGVDTSKTTLEQIPAICAKLEQMAPHFRFSTREGTKTTLEEKGGKIVLMRRGKVVRSYSTMQQAKADNPYIDGPPMVFEEWNGACPWEGDDPDAGVDEAAPPEEGGASPVEADEPTAEPEASGEGSDESPPAGATTDAEFRDDDDLNSLVERANGGEPDAQQKLVDFGIASGLSEDQCNALSWEEIRDRIMAGDQTPEEEPAAPPAPPEPELQQVVKFTPPSKNGKVAKPVDCTIVHVDKTKRLVNLKNLDDGKTIYRQVSFDKIS